MKKKTFDASLYNRKTIEQSKTYDVEMPSGFVFTLRRPNVQAFAASGILPSHLFQKMIAAEQDGGIANSTEFSPDEIAKMLKFGGSLVRAACVVPRIVDEPQTPKEIRFEQLSDEDFTFIVAWCNSGGVEGENLSKFRRKS